MADTLEEPELQEGNRSTSPGFVNTLDVDTMIKKLLAYKDTGKQVDRSTFYKP